MRRFRLWIALAVVFALPAIPRRAQADPFVTLCCGGIEIMGPNSNTWGVGIIISSGIELLYGDYFTISGIAGLLPGSAAGVCRFIPPPPAGLACSWSSLYGPNSVTFTWTAADPAPAGLYYPFTFTTLTSTLTTGGFSAQATDVATGQKVYVGGSGRGTGAIHRPAARNRSRESRRVRSSTSEAVQVLGFELGNVGSLPRRMNWIRAAPITRRGRCASGNRCSAPPVR
jgi:hypothetical protein